MAAKRDNVRNESTLLRLLEHGDLATREQAWEQVLRLLVAMTRRGMTEGDRRSRESGDVAVSLAGDLLAGGFDPVCLSDDALRAYLRTALRHKLGHYGRRRRAAKRIPHGRIGWLRGGESLRWAGPDPAEQAICRETVEQLTRAIAQLPEEGQLLVSLFLAGVPFRGIAEALRISEPAFRQRLRRLRRALGDCLEPAAPGAAV